MSDAVNPTGKEIDFAAEVRKAWGKEWSAKEVVYRFSNGRTFQNTDADGGGPYQGTQT